MTTSSLGQLTVDLVVATSGFEAGMDQAARTADKKTREIERLAKERARNIEAAFKSMAVPLAAVFGGTTFVGMIKGLADSADGLAKMSARTGVAVESLSKLKYAGNLADASSEDLSNSLTRLNRVLGEASSGSKNAVDALKRFDIKPGTGTVEAFQKIADKVKDTGDATKVASALNDVFGKSWTTLVPLLKGGADGLRTTGDELERMGGVMSGDLAAQSEAFNDNITRLQTQMDAWRLQTIAPLMPLLLELSKTFVSTGDKADDLSLSAATLKTTFEAITVLGVNTKYVFEQVGSEIGGIAAQIRALGSGDFKAFSAIQEMMKEDAIAARKEIDALSERLLNPPKIERPTATTSDAGISDAPATKAIKAIKEQVSEGQKLIDQLKNRLLSTQDLTEVEQLQARLADKRYNTMTSGERDIAAGIAAQIDQHKLLGSELDQELSRIRAITDEYAAQDSRLQSLIASTPAAQNSQKMVDEAIAESALRSGQIDTTTYDQIIGKLGEVKEAGDDTFSELQRSIEGWGNQSADAITEFCLTGKLSFSDMARSIVADLMKMAVKKAIVEPLFNAVGGAFGGLFASANGNVFNNAPGLSAYSNQIVSKPTVFPFAKGTGLMGEAGPEAIMPLKRGADGKLGVSGGGGGGSVTVTNNVTINGNDSKADSRAEGQQAAALAKLIEASTMQVLTRERRPGGLLYAM